MANELTEDSKKRIDDILKKDAFDNAQSQNNDSQSTGACMTCKTVGGGGMVVMYGTFIPCPSCNNSMRTS